MSGRPEFSQAGTNGGGQTVAVTNRPEVEELIVSHEADIPPDEAVETEVYAPSGSVYQVLSAEFRAESVGDATEGSHLFKIYSFSSRFGQSFIKASYSDSLWYRWNTWYKPQTPERQIPDPSVLPHSESINTVRATEDAALVIEYTNYTDATQTDNVQHLLIEEVSY